MARNRVIYQSEGLYVGPTSGEGHNENLDNGTANSVTRTGLSPAQLTRIQSINYGFDIPRQDVNQFGQLARIDQVILEQPTVDLDFSYYTETGFNEKQLGFYVGGDKGALAHFISGNIGKVPTTPTYNVPGSNFYIRTDTEGTDLNTSTTDASNETVIGIGNAFITNFTTEASVGSFPTTSITAEALNMKFYGPGAGVAASATAVPAVKPEDGTAINNNFLLPPATQHGPSNAGNAQPSALRPGDIQFDGVVDVSNRLWRGVDASDLKIQSFSISADMSRENLERLGSKFAYSKELEFPMTVTLSMDAIVGDQSADALSNIVNSSDADYDIAIAIAAPGKGSEWDTSNGKQAIGYKVKGLKTDSLSISSSIGDNKSISLTATAQIGSSTDTANGLFIFTSGQAMGNTSDN